MKLIPTSRNTKQCRDGQNGGASARDACESKCGWSELIRPCGCRAAAEPCPFCQWWDELP